jgi:chromate transporter
MTTIDTTEPAGAPAPTTAELFRGFLMLGLTGFGGVLPLTRHMVVEQRRWLTAADFNDTLSLCQFLPGGNVINLSVAIGLRFKGIAGAVAAIVGLIAAPVAVVLALGLIYARFRTEPHVVHMFAGLAAAAAGQLVAMAVKLALPLRRRPLAIAIGLVVFAAIAVFQLPLVPTMLIMAPLSIFAMAKAGT